MPTICRFFGIVISMYYDEHFHVSYAGELAIVRIDPLGLLEGELSPRALGLVMEWARLNRLPLLDDWERARRSLPLASIDPLV